MILIPLVNGQQMPALGLGYPAEDGVSVLTGAPPNELTSSDARDRFAGTPWHKHVPARVEAV